MEWKIQSAPVGGVFITLFFLISCCHRLVPLPFFQFFNRNLFWCLHLLNISFRWFNCSFSRSLSWPPLSYHTCAHAAAISQFWQIFQYSAVDFVACVSVFQIQYVFRQCSTIDIVFVVEIRSVLLVSFLKLVLSD